MKPKFQSDIRKSYIIYKLIFIASVILSLYVTWCVTGNILDADASSELILSKHLFDTKQLLSADWFYSTELRVVNTQLIYAPLFLIFNDWHKVRFTAAIIMQAIIVIGYWFMISPTKPSKKSYYLGASLIILPLSVSYGRIVLYHCYYIPHIAFSYILMGLILRLVNDKCKIDIHTIITATALSVVSFLGGLGGIRNLLIFHIPLIFAVVVMIFVKDFKNFEKSAVTQPLYFKGLLFSIISAGFAALGFIINNSYFKAKYVFGDYTSYTLGIIDNADTFADLLYGLLHQFGFRDNVDLMSVLGITSVLGSLAGIFLICTAVSRFIAANKTCDEENYNRRLLQSMFISVFIVLLCVFILTAEEEGYYYPLYFIPVTSWFIPFLMCMLEDLPDNCHNINTKKLLPYMMVAVFFLNGLINIGFYLGVEQFEQTYEGLSFQSKNIAADISGPMYYVRTNGYTHGYATFWYSNIITEITDGQITMSNIRVSSSKKFKYYDWLTLQSQRGYHEKTFIMLLNDERYVLEDDPELQGKFKLVYDNGHYFVYAFSDEHTFHDVLTSRQ
ncbi:MAG: hypothetical protein E7488_01175 [Ruminococcaceae bacterium]|nr:hypothetical protein [Oscillospiraceae bacterium]